MKTNTNIKTRQVVSIQADDGKLPERIELIKAGAWDTVGYGHIEITPDDLKESVKNFKQNLRAHSTEAGIPINFDHDKNEAAAWIKDVEFDAATNSLWATALEYTKKGAEAITDKLYKFFSPEYDLKHLDMATGEIIPNVLVGGALTNYPIFKDLQAVKASENADNVLYVAKVEADEGATDNGSEGAGEASESMEYEIEEIQDAFRDWELNPLKMGIFEITETHADFIIVKADPDWSGLYRTYKVMYNENVQDDSYEFMQPVEVVAQYVEAAELTSKKRSALPDSEFAYIDKEGNRKLPVNDKAHAQNAVDRFNQTDFDSIEAKDKARGKVISAAKKFNIDTTNIEAKEMNTNNKNDMGKENQPVEGAEKDVISISAAEMEKLQIDAAEGRAALLQVKRMEAAEKTHGWLFNEKDGGKFPTTSHDALTDFVLGLSNEQLTAFEGLVDAIPNAKQLFEVKAEEGEGATPPDTTEVELVAKANAILADEKRGIKTFGEAIKVAGRENPELAQKLIPQVARAERN